jgi:hypothetical protein
LAGRENEIYKSRFERDVLARAALGHRLCLAGIGRESDFFKWVGAGNLD